jgi:3-vinyl bacteriochlorophyllide hydratase
LGAADSFNAMGTVSLPTAAAAAPPLGAAATSERPPRTRALYTPEQRRRRDETRWTLVQGVLAPVQFVAFAVSAVLVLRALATGAGYAAAAASVVVKTTLLYLIMVTGAIWEKRVFGVWLFAEAFFWEDVFSMLVIALHSLYVAALVGGWWSAPTQLCIALAAYATYVINAGQFVWKLRQARLGAAEERDA